LKARRWEIIRFDDEEGRDWVHHCARCRKSSAEILAMPVVRKARRA
jgi:hypothetical protein